MTSSADLQLVLLAGCADACCWGGADFGAGGEPETLTYTNTGAASQALILVVDTYAGPANGGEYDLAIMLR